MSASASRVAAIFLIFFCASAIAQEKKTEKASLNVPCQKRIYKGPTAIFDGWMDISGSEHPAESEMLKDRGRMEATPYTAPDGSVVSLIHAEFGSVDIARKNFEAVVASARQVLERGPAIGSESSGTGVGERVLLDSSHDPHESFTIMWQNKQYLYLLRSSSLHEVEDFEEKFAFDCK